MATPLQPGSAGLSSGDNKLVRGSAKKTYSNNSTIIAALLFSEIVEMGLPGLGAIPAAYRIGGKAGLISALAIQIELIFITFPTPPAVTGVVAATTIVNKFGADEVAAAIDNASTAGIGPDSGYLYILKDNDLNIPAGQYSKDAVWRSAGVNYAVNQKSQWAENIDWLYMVPNLSWLGEWIEYTGGESLLDQLDREQLPPGVGGGSGGSFGGSGGSSSSEGANLAPLIGAGLGFLIGGPPGAAIGLVFSNFLTTDSSSSGASSSGASSVGFTDVEILDTVIENINTELGL